MSGVVEVVLQTGVVPVIKLDTPAQALPLAKGFAARQGKWQTAYGLVEE